jgi:hypothetical protein
VGLEPTIRLRRTPVFETGPSSGRMTSVCSPLGELRELESNQRPPDSESGVTTSSNCPALFHQRGIPFRRGSGRRIRTFIACFKGRQPAVSRSPSVVPKVPCGSRTRLVGLEGRHLCRSAKGTFFFALSLLHCAREVQAAVAGIEPASGRLTTACPYQHRPHRNRRVGVVGFEPTISCSRNTRISRLSYTPMWHLPCAIPPKAPSGIRTRATALARQQAAITSWVRSTEPNCQRPGSRH